MPETEVAPDSIGACHARLSRILGPTAEPIEVICRVDEHRQYWKPETVRVVLLAESHVFTPASELRHALRPHPLLPHDLPRGFVRFVYSIGCGENGLLDEPLQTKNGGSPQFWKVLYACTRPVERNEDFAPVLKSGAASPKRRLKNKLAVLVELRDRGVWLVDASLAALYTPGRGKPSHDTVAAAIRVSWDAHVGDEIRAAKPEAILVVGYVTAHSSELAWMSWLSLGLRFPSPTRGCPPLSTSVSSTPTTACRAIRSRSAMSAPSSADRRSAAPAAGPRRAARPRFGAASELRQGAAEAAIPSPRPPHDPVSVFRRHTAVTSVYRASRDLPR